jgi:hypothetical protein
MLVERAISMGDPSRSSASAFFFEGIASIARSACETLATRLDAHRIKSLEILLETLRRP